MRSRIFFGLEHLSFFIVLLLPSFAAADVAQIAFTTDPQQVGVGAVSKEITVQTQNTSGQSTAIPQTGCLQLLTTSSSGEFSSNATSWSAVSLLTMNKNTANRSFYYKDPSAGTYTLTLQFALKPESETRSCTNWPTAEWSILGSAAQQIVVGEASSGSPPPSPSPSPSSSSSSPVSPPPPSSTPNSYVPPPEKQIFADAGKDQTVIVGGEVEFKGQAYNKKKEPLTGLIRYSWNFGDGTTAEGQSVLHEFIYPGRYAVMLQIAQETETAFARVTVDVKEAQMRLIIKQDGALAIQNLSAIDLDLSRWILRAGEVMFPLKPGTEILKGATVVFSPETTGIHAPAEASLLYPNGSLALVGVQEPAVSPTPPPPAVSVTPPPAPAKHAAAKKSFRTRVAAAPKKQTPQEGVIVLKQEPASAPAAEVAAAAESVPTFGKEWWIAAAAIIGAGAAAAYVIRRRTKKKWTIVDDSGGE